MSNNKRIGWVLCEEAAESIDKPKIVSADGKRVIGEGTLQRANSKNRNGRFYTDKELFPQLTCARTKELLKTGFGSENGHPMDKDLVRQQTIDPDNVVAYFLKLWTEGDLIKATFRGSNLDIGRAFDEDLRDGFLPAWSLRALGSIENTPRGAEVRGLKVITWDRVFYPSHPEAYTSNIVSESGIVLPQPKTPTPVTEGAANEKGLILPIVNSDVLKYIASQSKNIKNVMESFEMFYDSIELVEGGSMVQLTDKENGHIYRVTLENHLHNEIIDYCSRIY